MYESPITKMIDDITTEMIHQQEDAIMVQVKQSVGYDIDKYELVKALQNDRNQYEKGFNDCIKLIDDIKAEVEGYKVYLEFANEVDWINGVDYVLSVIDKHIGREFTL